MYRQLMLITLLIFLSACSPKKMMVSERLSPFDLNGTIATIQKNAQEAGWVTPKVINMNDNVAKNGGEPLVAQVRILELCNAKHAATILNDEDSRYAAVFMPCSIAVYTKADGKTYVSSINAGQMGNFMGGVVDEVMTQVDSEQHRILRFPVTRTPAVVCPLYCATQCYQTKPQLQLRLSISSCRITCELAVSMAEIAATTDVKSLSAKARSA